MAERATNRSSDHGDPVTNTPESSNNGDHATGNPVPHGSTKWTPDAEHDPVHDLAPELLQAGWRVKLSNKGRGPYYYNTISKKLQWELPLLADQVGQVLYIL